MIKIVPGRIFQTLDCRGTDYKKNALWKMIKRLWSIWPEYGDY